MLRILANLKLPKRLSRKLPISTDIAINPAVLYPLLLCATTRLEHKCRGNNAHKLAMPSQTVHHQRKHPHQDDADAVAAVTLPDDHFDDGANVLQFT